jgi:integration host factor subunit alpha
MTLTKADLIDSIYHQVGFSRTTSTRLVESLMETMKGTLARGEDVLISGFGKFSARAKARRRGRNPATGEDLTLKERRIVTFKCSSVLRNRINGA